MCGLTFKRNDESTLLANSTINVIDVNVPKRLLRNRCGHRTNCIVSALHRSNLECYGKEMWWMRTTAMHKQIRGQHVVTHIVFAASQIFCLSMLPPPRRFVSSTLTIADRDCQLLLQMQKRLQVEWFGQFRHKSSPGNTDKKTYV